MPSPLGHTLVGVAIGRASRGRAATSSWVSWYLLAVFAANAADLDLVPGLLVGDVNRFHHWISHSILAALLFALLAGALALAVSARPKRIAAAAGLLYASHLALDYFAIDTRAPYGIPLFWPITSQYFQAPVTPFGGIEHGVTGDSLDVFLRNVFSLPNLQVLALEAVLLAPVLAVVWILTNRSLKDDGSTPLGRRRGSGERNSDSATSRYEHPDL